MRMSEVFKVNNSKRNKNLLARLIFIFSGIAALAIVLVTIYGQYTGTHLIGLTREAERKGIILSTDASFSNSKDRLQIEPLENVDQMVFSLINTTEAEQTDGQYFDTNFPYYIAYTFYLKNIGDEVVDVEFRLQVVSDYNSIGDATVFRIREFDNNDNNFNSKVREVEYKKNYDNNLFEPEVILGDSNNPNRINNFKVGQTKKFTLYLWFDGPRTNPDNLGGAFKFDVSFAIAKNNGDKV